MSRLGISWSEDNPGDPPHLFPLPSGVRHPQVQRVYDCQILRTNSPDWSFKSICFAPPRHQDHGGCRLPAHCPAVGAAQHWVQ